MIRQKLFLGSQSPSYIAARMRIIVTFLLWIDYLLAKLVSATKCPKIEVQLCPVDQMTRRNTVADAEWEINTKVSQKWT